ncbi:MAG: GatB/YqeY domain-containing protein [Myxococcales bacterium]|nr:GatB/YqeY domain-containing protein [Myxococcales bacterium]MCB9732540.1 GatB/YqeY domain-containing protein [Deltaproteobacteria bacterium]
MALEDRLKDDMKAAMKARDGVRLDTVRLLLADVKNRMIEKMGPLSPEEELALLSKQAKQRVEAAEAFHKGGREELAKAEEAQLEVIRAYLPEQLGDDEVKAIVAEVIAAVGAAGMKDMGRVMGALMPKIKGKYDGQAARGFVEAALKG